MRFGTVIFLTDETIEPAELAPAVEERGFESLWVPEHTHIPASRETPAPGGRDELPRRYFRTLDPFVALSAAAAATSRLLVGTGICLVVERDPIITAKEVASLDRVSGGRFLFGVGAGWNLEEMRNHGTDPELRFKLLRERVLAMKAIWTEEQAEFHGRFVDFDPIFCWPKPVQSPHPPILVAGTGPRVLERVHEYGDGWFPIQRTPEPDPELLERIRDASDRGIPVTVFGVSPTPEGIERYADAGVERCLFLLPSRDRDAVLAKVDELAALVGSLGG